MFADFATEDFFRASLDHMIDLRHSIAVLACRMTWQQIELLWRICSRVRRALAWSACTALRPLGKLGMTDIGEIVFLPALLERLGREAPGVTLNTVRNHATHLRDDMEAGKVDLAIGLLPHLKAGFFQRRLFSQRYVGSPRFQCNK